MKRPVIVQDAKVTKEARILAPINSCIEWHKGDIVHVVAGFPRGRFRIISKRPREGMVEIVLEEMPECPASNSERRNP